MGIFGPVVVTCDAFTGFILLLFFVLGGISFAIYDIYDNYLASIPNDTKKSMLHDVNNHLT